MTTDFINKKTILKIGYPLVANSYGSLEKLNPFYQIDVLKWLVIKDLL